MGIFLQGITKDIYHLYDKFVKNTLVKKMFLLNNLLKKKYHLMLFSQTNYQQKINSMRFGNKSEFAINLLGEANLK